MVFAGVFLGTAITITAPAEAHAREIQEIAIDAKLPIEESGARQTVGDGLLWTDSLESVSYSLKVPCNGVYAMELTYQALESKSDFIQLEGTLSQGDQKESFLAQMARPVEYGEIKTLDNGDQIRPDIRVSKETQTVVLRSYNQISNEPYHWPFSAGDATLTLKGVRTDFVLLGIRLIPYESAQPYEAYRDKEQFQKAPLAETSVLVQAENISRSSEPSLGAQYDRSDPLVEPSSNRDMLLNVAGGESYGSDGQWIEWDFDIKKSGLYALRVKARQKYKNGLSVNRRIYVDGKVPFLEAENMTFSYSTAWELYTLTSGSGEDALIYLEEGDHTIRMEVVPGPEAEAIVGIQEKVSGLMDIYRSIVMITGVNPDKNREYYLERDIPDLMDRLESLRDGLLHQKELLERLSGEKSGELSSVTTLVTQLNSFLEKPDTIPARLGNLKGNIDGLSSFMLSIGQQPLDMDYIMLASPKEELPKVNAGLLQNFGFELGSLFSSFFPKQEEEEDVLTVWVSLGRDQMQVIKDMTDNGYTAATGQKVEFSLVQQGITEAILAGTSPDVVLYTDNQEIVNLAMRGALESVDGYEGFEALKQECQSQAFIPYEYKEETYGVPLTQIFPMMFVRTDIFEELKISPPETWEELYAVIPAIQRKNMQVGIPSGDQTFATMLWQQGQGYYNQERTATNLDNETAVDTFTRYTRLFTDYDLPVTYDFFNRFRSGEMPLAIADYTEYNRLLTAAPEITGKWAMYPVPGTKSGQDLERSVQATLGQGGYVLSNSKRKEQAGEFLMWFASAGQQAEYARKSESLLGAIGRYAPANQEAFLNLPWLPKEQELILSQWQEVKEQPQMPGSYYTKRNLANAFRAVVYDEANNRESLLKYAAEIDRELERKAEEYR